MDAYRTPAAVAPEPLPNACVPDAAAPEWRHLTPALVRAVGAAATLFLLANSACLVAVAWRVLTAPARDAAPGPPLVQAAAPAPLACTRPPVPAPGPLVTWVGASVHGWDESALSLSGPHGTNDVDELWSRAQRIHESSPGLHLSRSVIPLHALTSAALGTDLHVGYWPGPGAPGLRVTEIDPRSPAVRAGLRRGDVITGVNGVAPVTPERVREAWDDVAARRTAVLEIARPAGTLVLRVDFRP